MIGNNERNSVRNWTFEFYGVSWSWNWILMVVFDVEIWAEMGWFLWCRWLLNIQCTEDGIIVNYSTGRFCLVEFFPSLSFHPFRSFSLLACLPSTLFLPFIFFVNRKDGIARKVSQEHAWAGIITQFRGDLRSWKMLSRGWRESAPNNVFVSLPRGTN